MKNPEVLTVHEYTLAQYWIAHSRDADLHHRPLLMVPPHEMRLLCEAIVRLDPEKAERRSVNPRLAVVGDCVEVKPAEDEADPIL